MKVKIGDTWHEPTEDAPILIAFDLGQKDIISHLKDRRLAYFKGGGEQFGTVQKKEAWMAEKLRCQHCKQIVEDGHWCEGME